MQRFWGWLGLNLGKRAGVVAMAGLALTMLFGLGVLPSFFNGLGHTRYYMAYSIVGFLVVLVLAPALAIGAGLGVVGLIISILIANATGLATGLYLASRFLNSRVDYRACVSILLASLLAYAAVLFVSRVSASDILLLPAEVVVFVAIYLTAAPLVRAINTEDLELLEGAFRGMGRFESVVRPILRYEKFIIRIAGLEPTRPTS